MNKGNFVFIWRGPLSQWAKCPMVVDGVAYCTCEQYMMAGKARLFGDHESEAKIIAAQNPRIQKSLGRKVKGFDQAAWEAACQEIVYQGNMAKFGQHPDLKAMLLATGDRILAEASPTDQIWGIGMAEDHPNVTDMSVWGQNLLGKVLMRVRDTFRAEGA